MKKGQKNPLASRNLLRADYRKHPAITLAEAAELAGVTIGTVEDWLTDGHVPRANRIGPYRVDRIGLDRFLRDGAPKKKARKAVRP